MGTPLHDHVLKFPRLTRPTLTCSGACKPECLIDESTEKSAKSAIQWSDDSKESASERFQSPGLAVPGCD